MKFQFFLILLFLSLIVGKTDGFSQPFNDIDLSQWNTSRLDLNKHAMFTLGSWALGNIAFSSFARSRTSGNVKYFHEMNAMWNVVNLGIAGAALYQLSNSLPSSFSFAQSIEESQNFEKILLFNAGLDLAYITGGVFLIERGLRKGSDRLNGYGRSLLLQGGFLFIFDVTVYFISAHHSSKLYSLLSSIAFRGDQVSLTLTF